DNSLDHVGVIDFNGVQGTTLFFDELNIAEGGYLVIKNLGDNSIAGHHHRSSNWEKLRSITIEIGGKLMEVRHYWQGNHWSCCEWAPYDLIVPTYNLWTPIPEPGTYGQIFAALGVGVASFRRKRGGKRLS
ncbi:PEP-CTERM sorting domain-containing protein, partial [Cephaloticoccus capnophilus]|uniref:PEP-CTERM sorting domain-containing protein n=1 Tax=Cephaloticoccus capnophilus TaxID=1548208 RepID=UPI001E5F0F76